MPRLFICCWAVLVLASCGNAAAPKTEPKPANAREELKIWKALVERIKAELKEKGQTGTQEFQRQPGAEEAYAYYMGKTGSRLHEVRRYRSSNDQVGEVVERGLPTTKEEVSLYALAARRLLIASPQPTKEELLAAYEVGIDLMVDPLPEDHWVKAEDSFKRKAELKAAETEARLAPLKERERKAEEARKAREAWGP